MNNEVDHESVMIGRRESPMHDACLHGADAFRTGAEAIALGYMGSVGSAEHQPKRRRIRRGDVV